MDSQLSISITPSTVAVLTSHQATRMDLQQLFTLSNRFHAVGYAANVEELSQNLPIWNPNIVLWEFNERDLEALLALLTEHNLPLVALCEEHQPWEDILKANLPSRVFVHRNSSEEKLFAALEVASLEFTAWDNELETPIKNSFGTSALSIESIAEPLTNREREVLQLMALGLPNKQIAARLGISLSTVKFHVASILTKLHVESRTEAVTEGIRRGLVSI